MISKLNGISASLNGVLAACIAIVQKVDSVVLWHAASWTIVAVAVAHLVRAGIAIHRYFK